MSQTLTLDARRQAAAARMSSVPLPEFKGKAGWEFTPLGKLDLDALPAAPSNLVGERGVEPPRRSRGTGS